ncbi:hypothetical protein MCC10043_1136 [Bifidobacterium longum subsp. longum]|uniref:Uncharacterized protein n=1 Tax=Bifidobacterium longum subsp. longum TaxID=1679 RepID=A0AB38IEN1_BIFLL|nr:hypothetical protein MCC10022_1159 [Bifidobacterium longum subsp. longum]TCE40687.1 hypothetical protein MCC10043_1136 [Bifidobacterium longum subsp. longum]TCE63474.1 hypothetical protein MCC10055_0944 [Bifidobacterium longum subsp. longum]
MTHDCFYIIEIFAVSIFTGQTVEFFRKLSIDIHHPGGSHIETHALEYLSHVVVHTVFSIRQMVT